AEILKAYSEAGVKLGLCTNKPTDVSEQILRDLGVREWFGSVIGGTSGYAKKPDPEPMMACMEELGVIAARTVFVGDSIADVETARNANLPVIVMSYGYTPIPAAELGGDVVIDRLDEIPQAIEGLKSA
ncbi:MAG: phosphoglycolate phosphatase, partial [Hyphomicrobiales bacterium]